MIDDELMQYAGIAAFGLAGAALLYGIVRFTRKQHAIFPETAKKYGLTFTREPHGSLLGNIAETLRLRGVANGTPVEVISTYKTRGNMNMKSTLVASRAPAILPACTININQRPSAATVHLVPTGDVQFDTRRWVTSDAPVVVREVLTPVVRTQLLRCPQPELRLVFNDGHVILSFPNSPGDQAELHAAIDVVLAVAGSKTP